MSIIKLSKTNYLSYLACPEECWMSFHQPELMPPFSKDAKHNVEQGNIIDQLAQERFKHGGVINGAFIPQHQIAFQYQVQSEKFLVKADITVFHGEKECDIYEVKSSTKLKTEHKVDIAFQRMVFESQGYKVRRTFLIHVNSKYPFQNPPDLKELLQIKEVTAKVDGMMEDTRRQAEEAWEWIHRDRLPAITTLTHPCGNGLDCVYLQHYHPPSPAYTIFDISRLRGKKQNALLEMGIIDIQEVPADFKLSDKQRLQVDVAQQKKVVINQADIKTVLSDLAYPIHFLDYETFAYVLPLHEGIYPYQQMVFQYSLHVIESEGSEVQHFEYLMPSKETPMEELFEQMSQQIHPTEGTVIVWNESFEKTQNKLMAKRLPQYADFLHSVNDRVYDLMKVFSQGLYVHPDFKGSASIKKVLPVLCPELNYQDLEIQNGGDAVIQWHHMTDGRMTEEEAKQTFQDLLKYCELDTWAMVRIWEELGKV
jgi:CRISPR/Cas system-associated exonuclease Cas4 (RecB family)